MNKKNIILLILSLLLSMICLLNPINNLLFRSLLILSLFFIITVIQTFLKNRVLKVSFFLLTGVIFILIFTLPKQEIDKNLFVDLYVKNLQKYENVKYVWGGENCIGIDCSGLIRKAKMDSYFELAIIKMNPAFILNVLELKWFDYTAKALQNNYHNQIISIANIKSINDANYNILKKGDLAVTINGVHVLAYLGNEMWIEADPDLEKVIIVQIPYNNPWFQQPVNILRWKECY